MRTATKAPFLTLVRATADQPLRITGTAVHSPRQKNKPFPAAAMSRDRLLCHYQSFIDAAIGNFQNDYRAYRQRGGTDSFCDRCWGPLLNEAVEEATALLNQYDHNGQNKEMLLQDLKRISEGCLLVLDKALA